jgi:hypothetical protein
VNTESILEQRCKRYAEGYGALLLKFQGMKGYPDRLLLVPPNEIVFLEFKKPGGVLAPLQAFFLQKLTDMGFAAHEVDNFGQFKRILDSRLPATSLEPT